MNSKADLLKKSQISFIVVNIKHQNTKTDSICSAELCRKKTRTKNDYFPPLWTGSNSSSCKWLKIALAGAAEHYHLEYGITQDQGTLQVWAITSYHYKPSLD